MKKISLPLASMISLFLFSSLFGTVINVSVQNFSFSPAGFNAAVGDSIVWTEVNGVHTTTSTLVPAGAASWNYSFSGAGDTYTYVIAVAGDYEYQCSIHPTLMQGTFSVTIPVELTSFSANIFDGAIMLNWQTATETNNSGFEIERKTSTGDWFKIGFVEGNGTTTEPQAYSFTDNNISPAAYFYRLKQLDFSGVFEYSASIEVIVSAPLSFELVQNYPNPFNPNTTIEFTIPQASNVSLKIYNLLGQEVRTLVNGIKDAGTHKINFDAKELNSGMYIYKIEAGSFTQVRKMTLLK